MSNSEHPDGMKAGSEVLVAVPLKLFEKFSEIRRREAHIQHISDRDVISFKDWVTESLEVEVEVWEDIVRDGEKESAPPAGEI